VRCCTHVDIASLHDIGAVRRQSRAGEERSQFCDSRTPAPSDSLPGIGNGIRRLCFSAGWALPGYSRRHGSGRRLA
jgi:hypothetical protein